MANSIYESTFTGAIDGIIIIDEQGNIIEINPAALDLFGYKKEETLGQNISMLMGGIHHKNHNEYLENYRKTNIPKIIGTSRELKGLKKSGSEFDFRLSVSEHKVGNATYFTGFVHDISERKKAEGKLKDYLYNLENLVAERTKTLEQNSRMLLTMAKNYPKFIISIIDEDFIYLFTEGKELAKMGLKSQMLIGTSYLDKFDQKATRDNVHKKLKEAFHKSETRLEANQNDKVYEILAVPFQIDPHQNLKFNKNLLIVESDITEEKKTSEKMANMLEKEKRLNEIKSRFVATASHEFKTPLTTIRTSTNLLKNYIELGQIESCEKHFQKIIRNVENLNHILKRFLSLEEINQGTHKPVLVEINLINLLEEVKESFANTLKIGQQINLNLQAKSMISDPVILTNILNNLISNSIKYSPENTTIFIQSAYVGNEIHILVEDQGMGMSEAEQEQVFEQFFRAEKAINLEGTGLGLSIVKNYVELLEGKINLESKPQIGSKLTLRFQKI